MHCNVRIIGQHRRTNPANKRSDFCGPGLTVDTDSFICISAGVQHLAGVQSPNTERDGNQPVCWNRQFTQESWTLQQAREERSKVQIRMCVLECVCEGLKRVKRLVSRSSSSAPLVIFLHIPLPSSLLFPTLAVFLLLFFYLSFYTFFLCFSVFI